MFFTSLSTLLELCTSGNEKEAVLVKNATKIYDCIREKKKYGSGITLEGKKDE